QETGAVGGLLPLSGGAGRGHVQPVDGAGAFDGNAGMSAPAGGQRAEKLTLDSAAMACGRDVAANSFDHPASAHLKVNYADLP
ncbi:hypothetical protein, partial [Xylophilus sp. Leaf220]|uniref:hypothetical protein n=1 Tax=Xylophilus sp. Leaf220 TaxID=1735686 RepID=UPI001F40F16D